MRLSPVVAVAVFTTCIMMSVALLASSKASNSDRAVACKAADAQYDIVLNSCIRTIRLEYSGGKWQ